MVRKSTSANKADAIRRYTAEHPDAMPVDIVAALGKRGIKTSTAYVSSIRHVEKKRKTRHVKTISTEVLMEAKEFINAMGDTEKARSVIERLEKIGGLGVVREAIDLISKISR
jgi:mRNA-degrading endonuclease toxin of MazEF toxin-antitoxin module